MGKFIYGVIIGLFVLAVPTLVSGANQQRDQLRIQSPSPLASPMGTGAQNQNQIQTQNEGEDNQIQTQNEENENGDGKKESPRSDNALEHMSVVAQKVQELLADKTLTGGIGEQIREIARAQNQEQEETENKIGKIESRGQIYKFIFGSDYKSLKELEGVLEQNQLRIETLTQLMNQVVNQGDKTMLQEMITALTEQNTALQEMITFEKNHFSLFGWFVKLLNK